MNPLLEAFLKRGLLFDILGVIGLALIALAAIKLARTHRSWGGTMMALGAIALLVARVFFIVEPHFVTNELLYKAGPLGITLLDGLPPLLLTMGLAGIVWGLWGHERWLSEENR
jgi:hypothetical protein